MAKKNPTPVPQSAFAPPYILTTGGTTTATTTYTVGGSAKPMKESRPRRLDFFLRKEVSSEDLGFIVSELRRIFCGDILIKTLKYSNDRTKKVKVEGNFVKVSIYPPRQNYCELTFTFFSKMGGNSYNDKESFCDAINFEILKAKLEETN